MGCVGDIEDAKNGDLQRDPVSFLELADDVLTCFSAALFAKANELVVCCVSTEDTAAWLLAAAIAAAAAILAPDIPATNP